MVALGLVLLAHGLLPGMVPNLANSWLAEGAVTCLNDLGVSAVATHCHDYAEPVGYPLLTAGPMLALGAILMGLPGIGAASAVMLSGALFDVAALAGGYALVRRLGAGPFVALGTATAYLLSPTIDGLQGFPGTFTGFVLLPLYAWADLALMSALDRGGRAARVAIPAYAALRTTALFMDGYSFVASALISAALWLPWLLGRARSVRRRGLGAGVVIAANILALVTYLAYVPASYEPNPLEIFRAMGLDLVTLVAPTPQIWLADALGYAGDHSDLWGDGTNAAYNYIGIVALALAIAGLVSRRTDARVMGLAVAGVIALVLSFGPSLKVNDVKPFSGDRPDFNSYLMPASAADVSLPWGPLFTAAPGIDAMRATYRWYSVTRLVVIVLAGLAIARLVRTAGFRRRYAAIALSAAAAADVAPNIPVSIAADRAASKQHDAFAETAGRDFRAVTRPGERVFILNYDGTHNDFLSNYLAATADVRAYNAGGDKNVAMAQGGWPAEIAALADPDVGVDAVYNALASRRVDVVIAPYFHLRWNAYSWPASRAEAAKAREVFAPILADPRFQAERRETLASIRLR
jgi:hypothetical protein